MKNEKQGIELFKEKVEQFMIFGWIKSFEVDFLWDVIDAKIWGKKVGIVNGGKNLDEDYWNDWFEKKIG